MSDAYTKERDDYAPTTVLCVRDAWIVSGARFRYTMRRTTTTAIDCATDARLRAGDAGTWRTHSTSHRMREEG